MHRIAVLLLLSLPLSAQTPWKFAVSGDSRNCGDVVVPAIANGVNASGAAFYWHLGDFRALYDFDEDMKPAAGKPPLSIFSYNRAAWPDFLRNQVARFAPLPVFLGIGNHELVNRTRADYITQFGDWLTMPPVQQQRLADDPNDHTLRTYYHWIQGGVDFVTLDNASADQFDDGQLAWIKRLIDADAKNAAVKAIVLGMHEALPHSLGCDHSMNESAQGEWSGDLVYHQLIDFREKTKKSVFILASHSHFLLRDVYGYLLGTVDTSGGITFDFREVTRADIPADVVNRVGAETVDWCFAQNRDTHPRSSEPCARADAPCGPTAH